MATVNLYDVLKLSSDCSQADIKRSYRKLAKKYHPDRKKDGDRELFELITEAYNMLSNPQTRADYDKIYNDFMGTQHHHHATLKEEFENYELSRKTDVTHLSKEESKKMFKKEFNEMDRRHNFRRENLDSVLDDTQINRFCDDLKFAREQDDIENMHNKIFDDCDRFDLAKFNEAYDIVHKSGGKLIPHTGNPDPWNKITGCSYSSVNNNNLYEESDDIDIETMNCLDYAPIIKNKKAKTLTKNDVEQLKGVSYTYNHDVKDDNYMKDFNQRVSELDTKRNEYNNMKFDDYKKDDFGGYGITEGIKDQLSLTYMNDQLDKDELDRKYQRLLELRKP